MIFQAWPNINYALSGKVQYKLCNITQGPILLMQYQARSNIDYAISGKVQY